MIRLAIFRNSTSDIVLGVVMLLALPVAGYAQFNEAASKSNRENQHAETTTSISSSLPNKHTFDEVRRSLAQQLVSTLQGKGIKQLAVTKIYYNGSSIQPVSAFIQGKVVGALLDAAQDKIDIMDRHDVELLVKENRLQWMIKGQANTAIEASQAVLVGELLWDKSSGQALLSLRIINTTTGQIIAAPAQIIDLDESLATHLGVAVNDIPTTPLLAIKADSEKQLLGLANRLSANREMCSFSSVDLLDRRYQFAGRVLYCLMCERFTRNSVTVLERELLYQIAGEQALAGKTLDSVLVGTAVISFQPDETTDASAPEFVARAVNRSNNAITGQAEIAMASPKLTKIIAGTGATQVTPIGSEDALAAAIRKQQEQASVKGSDSLVFSYTVRVSDKMEVSEDIARFKAFGSCGRWYKDGVAEVGWTPQTNSINGLEVYANCLDAMIPKLNGDLEAIKAKLQGMAILGFEVGEHHWFPGALPVIAATISTKYTINRDQTASRAFWVQQLCGCNWINGGDTSLGMLLFESMHPKFRLKMAKSLSLPKGSAVVNFEATYPPLPIPLKCNYEVVTEWAGKFPSTVKVTIDLTPMRDKLYKVKPTQDNE